MDDNQQHGLATPNQGSSHPPGHVIAPMQTQEGLTDSPTPVVSELPSEPVQPVPAPVTPSVTQPPVVSALGVNNDNLTPTAQPPGSQPPVMNMDQPPAPPASKKPKMSLIIGAVIIIVLLIVGVIFGLHALNHKSTPPATSNSNKTNVSSTTTTNCSSDSCFEANFTKCTPSSYTTGSSADTVKYQIYGKKGNGCSMLLDYVTSSTPGFTGASMTCNFDNSMTLQNSVQAAVTGLNNKQNTYSCTGSLVAAFEG